MLLKKFKRKKSYNLYNDLFKNENLYGKKHKSLSEITPNVNNFTREIIEEY